MKIVVVFLSAILMVSTTNASLPSEVMQTNKKVYDIAEIGVRDLIVDVRIKGLTKTLESTSNLGNLTDVYFRVFWNITRNIKYIKLEGLPEGFLEIKNQLKQLIIPHLNYIKPMPVEKQFSGIPLKGTKEGVFTGPIDDKKNNLNGTIQVRLNRNGVIEKVVKSLSGGVFQNEIEYNNEKKRYYVEKFITENTVNNIKTRVVSDISYTRVNGFLLPEKINLKTKMTQLFGKKLSKEGITSNVIFSDYQINTGRPQKVILDLRKK